MFVNGLIVVDYTVYTVSLVLSVTISYYYLPISSLSLSPPCSPYFALFAYQMILGCFFIFFILLNRDAPAIVEQKRFNFSLYNNIAFIANSTVLNQLEQD